MAAYLLLLALFAVAQARPQGPVKFSFSWRDCGQNPFRPLKIHSLSISPDPVTLPGIASVSFEVESRSSISNMDLSITLKKKTIIGEVRIPCVDSLGSCKYTDLCQYIERIPGSPVTCPLPAARFSKKDLQIPLPDPGSLGPTLKGSYSLKAHFFETGNDRELGCFELDLSLQT